MMETVAWTNVEYKPATSLPKLRIGEDIARRDSITSSRTHDSGYTSDPDWDSIPPCEIPPPPQHILNTPLDISHIKKHPLYLIRSTDPSRPSQIINDPSSGDVLPTHCSGKLRLLSSPRRHEELLVQKLGQSGKVVTSTPRVTSCPPCSAADDSESAVLEDDADRLRDGNLRRWMNKPNLHRLPEKERLPSIASLSSTGSAGDYSVTDDSEDEEREEADLPAVPQPTRKAINLIMRKIEVNLGYVAYVQSAGGQPSRGQASSTSSSTPGSRRGSAQHGPCGKRKAKIDDGTPNDDPEDDGFNKRRRVSVAATEDSVDTGTRFACPFYKHDPIRYRGRKTCIGPGWPTVHRMKEHLYRSHAQPIFCPRCYTEFDNDSKYATHARTTLCEVSAPRPMDGIDRETLKLIRRRSPPMRLEEDKWRDTYQIIFPEVHDADIPSPYYDHDSPTEESRRFRRELLSRIRSELFAAAERENGPVEQALLHQVAEIIQRCEGDLLNSFHESLESMETIANVISSSTQPPASFTPHLIPSPSTFTPAEEEQDARTLARQSSGIDSAEYLMQLNLPPTQYATVPGEFTLPGSSSDVIDWNSVFLPWSFPTEQTEPMPPFSARMWT